MIDQPWYRFRDTESIDECRDRRLMQCPQLSPLQFEVLRQMTHAVWDGYVISKSARDELVDMGLVTRYNGWQIASREGLAVLDTLGALPSKYSSNNH